MSTRSCDQCGAALAESARTCGFCGAPVGAAGLVVRAPAAPPLPPAPPPSVPAPPPPVGPAVPDRKAGRRPTATLAAAAAAVVLAGGGVWAANALTPAPLPEVVIDTTAAPHDLVSQTGNLWCHFETEFVRCAVKSVTWDAPAPACAESAVAVAVEFDGEQVSYPCVATPVEDLEGAGVLERDMRYVSGRYTCVLATPMGLTCTDTQGEGFRVGADTRLTTLP